MKLALPLLAFLLAGCTTAQGRWISAEDSEGVMHRVLHIDGPCPSAIDIRGTSTGCCYSGPVVWAGGVGESVEDAAGTLDHEINFHHKGGKHGPWQMIGGENCARITAAGRTTWREGWLMCRSARGYYSRSE